MARRAADARGLENGRSGNRRHRLHRQPRRRDRLGGEAAGDAGDRLRARAGSSHQGSDDRGLRRRAATRRKRHRRGKGRCAVVRYGGGAAVLRGRRRARPVRGLSRHRTGDTRAGARAAGHGRRAARERRAARRDRPRALRALAAHTACRRPVEGSSGHGRVLGGRRGRRVRSLRDVRRRARRAGRHPARGRRARRGHEPHGAGIGARDRGSRRRLRPRRGPRGRRGGRRPCGRALPGRRGGAVVLVVTGRNIDDDLWRRACDRPASFPA